MRTPAPFRKLHTSLATAASQVYDIVIACAAVIGLTLSLSWTGLASAATAAEPVATLAISPTGIISPDVATGLKMFNAFRSDAAGNMEVCAQLAEDQACRWVKLRDQVPPGRTYVGFRRAAANQPGLELYWK